MPKFYLDLTSSQVSAVDEVGMILPDEGAGRRLALANSATVAKEAIQADDQQSWFATLRDVYGNTLYRAKLTLAGHWEDEGR